MPCYSRAKCRVLRPVPHGSLLGDRIFNSSRVFCSCLPSLQMGSPQRPPVLAVGGCWRRPPRRAAQRGARSVFTRSLCCWRIVTLPGKNPVSWRVRRLAGITLVFTGGVLAPGFSSAWSRSSIQVTFHFCECGDLGLFYLFLYLGAPNSGWRIGSA